MTKATDDLAALVDLEERMMHWLDKRDARLRIIRVEPFYLARQGEAGWKRIKAAMVAKYKLHHSKR